MARISILRYSSFCLSAGGQQTCCENKKHGTKLREKRREDIKIRAYFTTIERMNTCRSASKFFCLELLEDQTPQNNCIKVMRNLKFVLILVFLSSTLKLEGYFVLLAYQWTLTSPLCVPFSTFLCYNLQHPCTQKKILVL